MNPLNYIEVNQCPINVNMLTQWLSQSPEDGAIVTFMGKVRSAESQTISLYLEHYQGMTEKVLTKIANSARERWSLNRIAIVHRVGDIATNEQIVFVGVSCAHRKSAFVAAEFIMDVLKTEAPFWKKEKTTHSDEWVDAKKSDQIALKKWY